jgi:hypothetical protein
VAIAGLESLELDTEGIAMFCACIFWEGIPISAHIPTLIRLKCRLEAFETNSKDIKPSFKISLPTEKAYSILQSVL